MLTYHFQSVECIKVSTLIALLRGVALIVVGFVIFPFFWKETGAWLTVTFAEVWIFLITLPIKNGLTY